MWTRHLPWQHDCVNENRWLCSLKGWSQLKFTLQFSPNLEAVQQHTGSRSSCKYTCYSCRTRAPEIRSCSDVASEYLRVSFSHSVSGPNNLIQKEKTARKTLPDTPPAHQHGQHCWLHHSGFISSLVNCLLIGCFSLLRWSQAHVFHD